MCIFVTQVELIFCGYILLSSLCDCIWSLYYTSSSTVYLKTGALAPTVYNFTCHLAALQIRVRLKRYINFDNIASVLIVSL